MQSSQAFLHEGCSAMNAAVRFQAVHAAAIVLGVGLAIYETRRYRSERNREAAMAPDFAKALVHVCRDEISMDLRDEFFSDQIVVSWPKLQGYFLGERDETGRETIGEWFQWLAERFAEREGATPPVPAHIQFRDWRPH
jgi:hypothetical protein